MALKKAGLKQKLKSKKEVGLQKIGIARAEIGRAKKKTSDVVAVAKGTRLKDFKLSKVVAIFSTFLLPPFLKFKKWYLALKPETLAGIITISTVAGLASLNIYVESNNIAEKSQDPAAELVEEVEDATAISKRPAYFKKLEKQFQVSNVVLPFYIAKGDTLKNLVIDFTFESSNKYIKEFLWNNPHLIHDTLNSKVEPLSIAFPLETEGKVIVKEKIIKEINSMLHARHIKGGITEVYIHSIIGG